ncbi:MAG: phosphatase PAP2 family protein [Clostridia bacterium]|nr:phosphatase PAP2 family protein [Clostridia bacterium]
MDIPALVPAEQWNAITTWLNTTFETFDYKILEFYNTLHTGPLGGFFDFFFEAYTHLGDEGLLFIVLGIIFLLFKKTRKVGFGMLFAVIIGALFTNVTIKPLVARPRPYVTNQVFQDWWLAVAHGLEGEKSFPSGHTTSTVAALIPVFMMTNKKKSWIVLVLAVLMGASRNYIMVHFPSDILGGIIIGVIAGLLACLIMKLIYDAANKNGNKLGNKFVEFDLAEVIKNKKKA